jgi:hypothetical protein
MIKRGSAGVEETSGVEELGEEQDVTETAKTANPSSRFRENLPTIEKKFRSGDSNLPTVRLILKKLWPDFMIVHRVI